MHNRDDALTRKILEDFGPLGEFRPFADYDRPLDTIRVQVADCSTTERPYSDYIELLERNHVEDGQVIHVGFNVLCARAFCLKYKLPDIGAVSVSVILNKVAEVDKKSMPAILDIALPMLVDNRMNDFVVFRP